MTDQERALLLYLANAVREHLNWSPTGPRVSLKILEMIEAVKNSDIANITPT